MLIFANSVRRATLLIFILLCIPAWASFSSFCDGLLSRWNGSKFYESGYFKYRAFSRSDESVLHDKIIEKLKKQAMSDMEADGGYRVMTYLFQDQHTKRPAEFVVLDFTSKDFFVSGDVFSNEPSRLKVRLRVRETIRITGTIIYVVEAQGAGSQFIFLKTPDGPRTLRINPKQMLRVRDAEISHAGSRSKSASTSTGMPAL